MIQATISADIVSSSSLTVDEKVRIIANIRSFLADLELQSLGQCWGRIVKGDAVEIYCAEIAGLLNIKQSAVNQHSTAVGWNAIEQAVFYYENLKSNDL